MVSGGMFMKYINIGTNILMEEYFYQILNGDNKLKPAGGLWTTDYFAPSFNEWLDYICNRPIYYTRYMLPNDPFKMNCVIVTPKEGTRILDLDYNDGIEELEEKYRFDFESLARDYDGVYLDPYKTFTLNTNNKDEYRRLYSVRTLLLFDLKHVQEYKKGQIEIEPFDYTCGYGHDVMYDTKEEEGTFQIEQPSAEYLSFLDYMSIVLKDFIFHLRLKYPDYSSVKIAYIVKKELEKYFGTDILDYAKKNNLDEERISYSLAIKTLKKVK